MNQALAVHVDPLEKTDYRQIASSLQATAAEGGRQ
jgi:hypothetical protein